jgi:hypothetical protein
MPDGDFPVQVNTRREPAEFVIPEPRRQAWRAETGSCSPAIAATPERPAADHVIAGPAPFPSSLSARPATVSIREHVTGGRYPI